LFFESFSSIGSLNFRIISNKPLFMDRRKFISVSGISLVGLNGIVSASSLLFQKQRLQEVTNFLELIGAERLHNKLTDQQHEYILTSCTSWLHIGYKNIDGSLFWKAGEDTIICPMKLSSATKDSIDQVILVFSVQQNNEIKFEGSFSGFHLEIIALNQKELMSLGNADFIRSCILPYQRSQTMESKGVLTTKRGYFELAVKIEKNKTFVSSALKVDNKFIWQNSILSNHTLYSQSTTTS